MQKDMHSEITVSQAIAPQAVSDNTALVGNIINNAGYESLEYVISTGSLADADATFTTLVEEGNAANLSDASTVAAADILGSVPAITFADDNKTFKFGYRGNKQYTRVTITPANNASAANFACNAVQGHARHQPTAS